jgi:hypothetical protein
MGLAFSGEAIGELVALDVEADSLLGLGFEIDRLLAARPEIGRAEQPAADVGPEDGADRNAGDRHDGHGDPETEIALALKRPPHQNAEQR